MVGEQTTPTLAGRPFLILSGGPLTRAKGGKSSNRAIVSHTPIKGGDTFSLLFFIFLEGSGQLIDA